MKLRIRAIVLAGVLTAGALLPAGEDETDAAETVDTEHPNCNYFGPLRDTLRRSGLNAERFETHELSRVTEQVTRLLSARSATGDDMRRAADYASSKNSVDRHLFAAMQDAGVVPAPKTNDFEFVRRITLDLTGRIPTAERVLSFVADSSPDKREKLIDELLAKPEWVDKWTMFFGDLYVNMSNNTTTAIRRYPEGRNAFHNWIKSSLAANKPYNQMAAENISARGTDSYEASQGHINWMVNGQVTNGPAQDSYDQMAVNVASTFLGLSQMNCLLCHNGRGHLTDLSLWGVQTTRVQAWGLAAYFGKTVARRTPTPEAVRNQPYYWSVQDSGARDYQLNTTTGNRPARCLNNLPPTERNGRAVCASTGTITPEYFFNGNKPGAGENYRVALAREVTSDFQFSRAIVNYIWKEFFGRGIVDPVNQFDPARLDPDNPPPAPWSLQPSNARLLNALAQEFIDGGYDLKKLMKQIASSEAYQLSSRYEGDWDVNNEKLFARKLVRRLWAEEIHDAIAQSSNIIPRYNVNGGFGQVSWAMQFPEPRGVPGGAVQQFLDSFLRGNRDDEERKPDGSLAQALNLMNDPFVMTRVRGTGAAAANGLLAKNLPLSDEALVTNLFLAVLSRYPADEEKQIAMDSLRSGNRTQKAENLLWSLYNKVDFIFNY